MSPDIQLFGLNPLFWTPFKLPINSLNLLSLNQGLYYISNNYIQKVQISGVVVEVYTSHKYRYFTIDDTTSIIKCYAWESTEISVEPKIGDLVRITGRLQEFREEKTIAILDLVIHQNFEFEFLWWLDLIEAQKEYAKIFEYPESDSYFSR